MNDDVSAKIKSSLRTVAEASAVEPMIVIDEKGNYWTNDHVQQFIADKGIPFDELMEWLKIGTSHLQNISYGDMSIHMLRLPDNTVMVFLKTRKRDEDDAKTALTAKEKEVLRYTIKGLSNKQIARQMKISPGTVNSHLDRIFEKLGCSNRVAAGFLGLKYGLFLPSCERRSPGE